MSRAGKTLIHSATAFIFVLAFLTGTAWSQSGQTEHIAEWEQCLGIDRAATINLDENLWKKAQQWIDRCADNGTYARLKEEFPWFAYNNHRLLFHWGFNAIVSRYMPLLDRIKRLMNGEGGTTPTLRIKELTAMIRGTGIDRKKHDEYALLLKDYSDILPPSYEDYREKHPGSTSEDWREAIRDRKALQERSERLREYKKVQTERILKYLQDLHDGYKKDFIGTVSEKTGVPLERGAAQALASLIYDIHILLDYDDVEIEYLQELSALEKNVRENGLRRLVESAAEPEQKKKGLQALAAYDDMMASAHSSYKLRAQDIRNALKKVLPQILQDQYGKILNSRGIYLKDTRNNNS